MHDEVVVRRPRLLAWSGLAAFYSALFVVLAVFIQFFPLWLKNVRGLSAVDVTWVFAAQTSARTIAGPLWAQRVDRTGRPRRTLILLSLLSLAAFACFGAVDSPWLLVGCGFLLGCFYPAIHPILDAAAMATARRQGFAYGRLRVTGSIAFLVTVIVVGAWLERTSSNLLYGLLCTALVVQCGASLLLPDVQPEPRAPTRGPARAPIGELLGSRQFVLLLIIAALIQGSHAVYYNLSTIHWCRHGISEGTAGLLWAEGVLAEIVLFFCARGALERVRPTTMLLLGGTLAAVRWVALGTTVSVPWLFLSNWLHAFSFGCTYLGALRAVERRVPAERRSTAQGLVAAASTGVGMVVASLLGGVLYERFEGGAFFMMAGLALAGAGLALVLRRSSAAANASSSAASAPE